MGCAHRLLKFWNFWVGNFSRAIVNLLFYLMSYDAENIRKWRRMVDLLASFIGNVFVACNIFWQKSIMNFTKIWPLFLKPFSISYDVNNGRNGSLESSEVSETYLFVSVRQKFYGKPYLGLILKNFMKFQKFFFLTKLPHFG